MRYPSRDRSARMWSTTFFILYLATQCSAQSPSASTESKPSSTSKAPATTHTITVGDGDHKYKPDVTRAEIGDVILFQFFPQNHSVVRAEYEYPCIPYEMTGNDKVGFFSGFRPVDAILPDPPTYTITINDTNPIFFYCSAQGSCTDWGMVGAINPNSSTSISTQRNLALSAAYQLNPGEPFPAESSQRPTSPSESTPTDGAPAPPSKRAALSPGAIAGIVVAAISVLVLALILFFYIGRSKSLKEEMTRKSSTIRHVTPPSPSLMLQAAHYPNNIPPSYQLYRSPVTKQDSDGYHQFGASPIASVGGGGGGGHGVDRSASHRSVGGTFDISSTTGYYTRTHDGEDSYKYTVPQTYDVTSPNTNANWEKQDLEAGLVPLGPYGRQVARGGDEEGEGDHRYAVNEGQPAEMDGNGVEIAGKF